MYICVTETDFVLYRMSSSTTDNSFLVNFAKFTSPDVI